MTANQLVAFNLREARREKRWTQEEAAVRLAPYLGKKWPKASFSIAERSVDKDSRKRSFDANELLAFSQAFGKSVGWFFLPREDQDVICGEELDVDKVVSPIKVRQAAEGGGLLRQMALRKIEAGLAELKALPKAEEE